MFGSVSLVCGKGGGHGLRFRGVEGGKVKENKCCGHDLNGDKCVKVDRYILLRTISSLKNKSFSNKRFIFTYVCTCTSGLHTRTDDIGIRM